MEGSLESIFMHPPFHNPIITTANIMESNEDLQFKLMCASMELDKAKAEEKLRESKLWELQELLEKALKERDEAREECRKLRESLAKPPLQSNNNNNNNNMYDSPHSFMISEASMVSSSPSSFTLLQELEDHLNSDDFSPHSSPSKPLPSSAFHTNTSTELQQALDLFSQSCGESPDLEALFAAENSEAAFDLAILDQNLCFGSGDLTLELESKEQEEQVQEEVVDRQGDGYGDEEEEDEEEDEEGSEIHGVRSSAKTPSKPSRRSLSRQSSSNSSSASVQIYQRPAKPMNLEQNPMNLEQNPMNLEPKPMNLEATTANNSNSRNPNLAVGPLSPLLPSNPMPLPPCRNASGSLRNNDTASLRNNACPSGSLRNSNDNNAASLRNDASPGSFRNNDSMSLRNNASASGSVRKVHLPEPPEADPRVMLSSLPEKGKLLQAVMQAGPLLQTLLLAGPLPQWRHPPPALSSMDIPLVLPYNISSSSSPSSGPSSGSSSSSSPLLGSMPLCYAGGSVGPSPSSPSPAMAVVVPPRRAAPNPDPCSRSKKLRKLTPSPSGRSTPPMTTATIPGSGSRTTTTMAAATVPVPEGLLPRPSSASAAY